LSQADEAIQRGRSRSASKGRRKSVPKRVQLEGLKIRYQNGKIKKGEKTKFETITKEKIKIKRLTALLNDPLIEKALNRAALFYTSQSDLKKQAEYLDLKVKILTELGRK